MADRILVIDNHDSFVHTLVGYLRELGARVTMIEADAVADPRAVIDGFAGVLVSPGPGAPDDAGSSIDVVRAAAESGTPLLGVCLGHQALARAYGARVGAAPELVHGLTSEVHHTGDALFAGLPTPFRATRYHSLTVVPETLPSELTAIAWTDTGVIMGIAHRDLPIRGVQFHPEAVSTEGGYRLLGNWLEETGCAGAAARGAALRPHRELTA